MPKNKTSQLDVGTKAGRLTVIRLDHTDHRYRRYYLFRCECGQKKVIHGAAVMSGNTRSCGCLAKEARVATKLPNNQGVINQIILGYKRHARDRKLAWNLSIQNIRVLIAKNCAYCGEPPSNIKITKNYKEGFVYSGIDRVNPKRGYFTDNVVPCCSLCNRAKNNLSLEQFKEWVVKLDAMAEQWGGKMI